MSSRDRTTHAFCVWALVLSSVSVTWLCAACSPTVRDGVFRCTRGGCPSDMFCHPDGYCRRARPTGGDDAGPATADAGLERADSGQAPVPDSGTLSGAYGPCAPGCPSGQDCITEMGTPGYCSPRCTSDAMCPAYGGLPSTCAPDGRCRHGCTSTADCAAPLTCVRGRWSGGAPAACIERAAIYPSDFAQSCTSDGDCIQPDSCMRNACVRRCPSMGSSDCLSTEFCVPVPERTGEFACIDHCSPGMCQSPTICRGTPTGNSNCFPPSWPGMPP